MFNATNLFRVFFKSDDGAEAAPAASETKTEAAPAAPAKKEKKEAVKKTTTKKKAAAPKKKAKAAKKASPKKKAKAAKKSSGAPRAKKEGLRGPQVRVLKALAKATRALNRTEIGTKAEVDVATLTEYVGSSDKAKREANDKKKGWKSLISLGYVKGAPAEKEGHGDYYAITKSGEAALAKASA